MLLFYATLILVASEYSGNFIITKKPFEHEEESYNDKWLVNNNFELNNTICDSISPTLHIAHNNFVLVAKSYLRNVEDYLKYIPLPVFLNNYHRFLKKQRELSFDTDPFNGVIKSIMMSFLTDDNHFLNIKNSIYIFLQTEKRMAGYFKMFFKDIDEKLLNLSKFYGLSHQTQNDQDEFSRNFYETRCYLKKCLKIIYQQRYSYSKTYFSNGPEEDVNIVLSKSSKNIYVANEMILLNLFCFFKLQSYCNSNTYDTKYAEYIQHEDLFLIKMCICYNEMLFRNINSCAVIINKQINNLFMMNLFN